MSEVSTVVEQSFTPEALEARALGRLSMAVPEAVFAPAHVPSRGDHLLNPNSRPRPDFQGCAPARSTGPRPC